MKGDIKKITFDEFLKHFEEIPEKKEFQTIGKILALHNMEDEVVELNFNRGQLLYALVSKIKPKKVIEFGTGGGYGTMCMAWAMSDYNIDGKIFSIDILPNNEPWSRPIDYGDGIMIENLSNREVWKVLSKPKWQEKIETISGYSGQVISKNNFLDADFAYIDGGHFYEAVKHDFYSFLKNSNKKFSILFDDYIERESYGVKDFVDNEISKWFEVELIDTDPDHLLYKKNRTKNNEYGMCLISSESMNTSKDEILNSIEKDVMKYRRFEKRMIMRGKLNKKLPFLKNHKLSFWK